MAANCYIVKKEWLKRTITVEKAEQKNIVKLDSLGPEPVTFGYLHNEWLKLKENIREGDVLWEFRSPKKTWVEYCGRQGVCLVRNDEIVYSIVTRLN